MRNTYSRAVENRIEGVFGRDILRSLWSENSAKSVKRLRRTNLGKTFVYSSQMLGRDFIVFGKQDSRIENV